MIAVYARGRWAAFLSPSTALHVPLAPMNGDAEHTLLIFFRGDDSLPNPQTVYGWAPESMWKNAVEYVDERHADDMEATK